MIPVRCFLCNCLSYFTTAKISFTSILYPQFTHMIFIIYNSRHCTALTLVCTSNCGVLQCFGCALLYAVEYTVLLCTALYCSVP